VEVIVRVEALQPLASPLVGFYIKDRLGQALFGENTMRTYRHEPIPVQRGERLEARFRFRLPALADGIYTICVAVAEGSEAQHVIHHWIHDVAAFESAQSKIRVGVLEVPMHEITLTPLAAHESA
jgi:lipopolysaccharide transport system ATP-binding protein